MIVVIRVRDAARPNPPLDSFAGCRTCCNADHCREPIVKAIQEQVAELDFAPTFQFGHPQVFELAQVLADRVFPDGLASVDHLPHTHDPSRNTFTRSEPEHGGEEFVDRLLDLVALHDASTIAAVIVEPVAGSTGVHRRPRAT